MLLERTSDNTKLLKKSNEQRRNGMEDLYGVMFSADSGSNNNASFYVSLSPDYIYLQRFAFKLVISRKDGDVPPSVDEEDWEFFVDGVNITDYLIEQHDGYWIDGAGIYPTSDLDEAVEDDDEPNFYDILDVASLMQTEIDEESDPDEKEQMQKRQTKVLRRGFKKVEIRSEAPFHVDAYLYTKYSYINR